MDNAQCLPLKEFSAELYIYICFFFKVRLEMAENKIESMEKIDETQVQKLYSQNDDLRDQLRKAKM